MDDLQYKPPKQLSALTAAIAAAIAIVPGGLCCVAYAVSETWLNGGLPVSVSSGGRLFFFVFGGSGGALVAVLANALCQSLAEQWSKKWRLAAASTIFGCVGGLAAIILLSRTFITIPQEFFEFLTD